MILKLSNELDDLHALIRNNKAINVNSAQIKQNAIETGSFYFKVARIDVANMLGETDPLHSYDDLWHHLIRLAHGNSPKQTYLKVIKNLKKITKELNIASHSSISEKLGLNSASISYSDAEEILMVTLEYLVPSAAASYKQGIQDLNISPPRLSYRGTATEFREALRETLDHLAPDSEVKEESWFKLEKDCSGPTMKQKVRFVLSSRGKNKTKRTTAEKTVELIDTLCGEIFRAVYNRASLSTHVETSRDEVAQLKRGSSYEFVG